MRVSKTDIILRTLCEKTNAKDAILISNYGASVTNNYNFIEDDVAHSTICSVIVSVGTNLTELAKYGILNQIIIDCENGNIFLKSVSEECLIVLYVKEVFNLKHITKLLDDAVSEINSVDNLNVA